MKEKYELDTVRELWCAGWDGDSIKVGPDRDGLGVVELRYENKAGEVMDRLSIPPDAAELLAQAILDCAKELNAKNIPKT